MKMNMPRLIPSLLLLGFLIVGNSVPSTNATTKSPSDTHAAIDAYMVKRMQALKIPGAAVGIVQGDQVDYLRGYGVADSAGRAITPQTPFLLASLSKSFTALAIMQLVEAGKVNLDAPVKDYLPGFKTADEKASTQITVRQLLNHTSGISQLDGDKIIINSSTGDDALLASIKQLMRVKLIHAPGSTYEYSNINYLVLGAIVETASGQSYESYIEQKIFAPLDMKHSYTSMSSASGEGMTQGFYPFFWIPVSYTKFLPYSRALVPYGGLFSSAEDMAHYMIAQINDGRYKATAVLSPEGMAEMHTAGIQTNKWFGYAMGWGTGTDFDMVTRDQTSTSANFEVPFVLSHEGSYAIFRSVIILVPQEKIGVVVLMNTDDPAIESAFGGVGWDVLAIYTGNQPSYYPPGEDFIRQHVRQILIGINIFLLASFAWFIQKLRHWRQEPKMSASRWKQVIGYVVIPLAIDVLLAWFLLLKELPQSNSTVLLTLRLAPDIGLLIVLVLLFAIGWGAIRTILVLLTLFRRAANP